MTAATKVWRRFRLGLNTLIGSRPGGFFIPYRHAWSVVPGPYPALEPLFAAAVPDMLLWLGRIEGLGQRLGSFAGPPPAPRWTQDWFPRLDGAALYTIVRHNRPERVVEIGSGHSTRFIAQAVADGGFACTITCVDPEPRADIAQLPVTLRRRLWSAADGDVTRELRAGDVLLIDSSHVAVPGSDVDQLLNTVLPELATGVLVHLHDIFLPDLYPVDWTWRGYNEQVAVGCLLHSGGYAVRLASHYLATRHRPRLASGSVGQLPLSPGARECSLWLEKLPGAPVLRGDTQSA
ncbi:MAG: class I SAM-dependent methyltransferase [Geminicoccaceae bacterium]